MASFDDLQRCYQQAVAEQHDMERALARLTTRVHARREAMQKACAHVWERDPPQYQTRTSYTCVRCGAYR